MRYCIFFSLLGLLQACGKKAAPKVQSNVFKANIINGRVADSPISGSVGALVNRQGKIFCSGTLIGKKTFVTAGHCILDYLDVERELKSLSGAADTLRSFPVEEKRELVNRFLHSYYEGQILSMGVYFGSGKVGGEVKPQYKIKSVRISKRWIRYTLFSLYRVLGIPRKKGSRMLGRHGANDVAYLNLDISVEDIDPVQRLDEKMDVIELASQTLRLVGFGHRKSDADYEQNHENKWEYKHAGVKFEMDIAVGSVNSRIVRLYDDEKIACSGDSGGGSFVQLDNGEWRLVGVISTSSRGCEKRKHKTYGKEEPILMTVIHRFR